MRGFGSPTDRFGSNSAVSRFLRHGCFTPETGHCLARLARQKSATSRNQHRHAQYRMDSFTWT